MKAAARRQTSISQRHKITDDDADHDYGRVLPEEPYLPGFNMRNFIFPTNHHRLNSHKEQYVKLNHMDTALFADSLIQAVSNADMQMLPKQVYHA